MKMTSSVENLRKPQLPSIDVIVKPEDSGKFGVRNNVILEKGVVVTQEKMIAWEDNLRKKFEYYTTYPDLFVDEILTPIDSNFSLLFSQRIFLRAMMRFSSVHLTAARGFSKTFLSVLALMLKCIFQPRSQIAITAPSKTQAADIGRQKMKELLERFPLLKKELIGEGTFGKDYAVLTFRNGSRLEITAALATTRGRRYSALLCDELRDQDGDMVNSVLLPTLVISRRTLRGDLNPYEKHQSQIFTTSASGKSSYNYEKLLEIFEMSIIKPEDYIVFGIDYRVPVKEGLIDFNYIQQMKLAPTFNENDFAREFLSIYTSESQDSWFNFNQLNRHRRIVNAEWAAKNVNRGEQFYLLSVDVGRLHDQTVCTVFRVNTGSGSYKSTIVNIITLGRTPETRPFSIQVRDLKKIISAFNPKEIVVDINGLGIAIADEIIRPHWDEQNAYLEPLGFFNSEDYRKIQPYDAPQIVYGMKATAPLNSQMYGNAYARINAGQVDFLIKEQEARRKLLATKKGQRMSTENKVQRLMPYEMTTKLFEEMGNLRLKRTGSGLDIVLEQINTRFPKDKFSSMIMGLWRIKELEEQSIKHARKYSRGPRKLTFFTGG